jgi:hypothetical protein
MFACRDATDLMTDEREGALRGAQRVMYHLHLLICTYCRTCRRQLDDVVVLARETRSEGGATEAEASVLAALRARQGGRGESV